MIVGAPLLDCKKAENVIEISSNDINFSWNVYM